MEQKISVDPRSLLSCHLISRMISTLRLSDINPECLSRQIVCTLYVYIILAITAKQEKPEKSEKSEPGKLLGNE